jgi:hypothetical protein
MPTTPPKLRKGVRSDFNTLLRAAGDGALALVSVVRKADQQPVALVCAMQHNPDNSIALVPFAVMVEGNPFDVFDERNQTMQEITFRWNGAGEGDTAKCG